MKLNFFWNVWDNYSDVLLGSEIIYNLNKEAKTFHELKIYSQGGYKPPKIPDYYKYVADHFDVKIDENNRLIKFHDKYKGVLRVMNGIKQAYEVSLGDKADFVIITNADSWVLDIFKLRKVLEQKKVLNSAVSLRVGINSGLEISYGSYVPFFDDHFMILNLNLCKQFKIFEYQNPKAFNPIFFNYGGIHYMLGVLMDERVPRGLFNIYSDMRNCINHFGEKSGFSLLPWQYDPDHSLLHANCYQEPYLHNLRGAILKLNNFDRFKNCRNYCIKYNNSKNIIKKNKTVFFRRGIVDFINYSIHYYPLHIYHTLLKNFKYKKYLKQKKYLLSRESSEIDNYNLYEKVLPLSISSRNKHT